MLQLRHFLLPGHLAFHNVGMDCSLFLAINQTCILVNRPIESERRRLNIPAVVSDSNEKYCNGILLVFSV